MATILLTLNSNYGHSQTSIEQINLSPNLAIEFFIGASFTVSLEDEDIEFFCSDAKLIAFED